MSADRRTMRFISWFLCDGRFCSRHLSASRGKCADGTRCSTVTAVSNPASPSAARGIAGRKTSESPCYPCLHPGKQDWALHRINPRKAAIREGRDRMKVTINGREQEFPELQSDSSLHHLIELLQLKADRVAVERNGDIVPRANWTEVRLEDGDKLEVVQFVGGGLEPRQIRRTSGSS